MLENLTEKVRIYVDKLFEEADCSKLTYHSYKHTLEVVSEAKKLSELEFGKSEKTELLEIAAYFHDCGYLFTYHEHEAKGIEIAETFLKNSIDGDSLNFIADCIWATKLGLDPKFEEAALLKDIDLAYGITEAFFFRGPKLRKEWELNLGKTMSDADWEKLQFDFLNSVTFYSDYGKRVFRPKVEINLMKQKQRLSDLKII